MEQVQRAAMAPANPSPQDAQVAAQAAAKAASARQELAAERARSSDEENNPSLSGVSSVRAGLMFENLHGEYHEHEHHHHHEEEDHHHADALYPVEAYSRNMSGRGLWTLRNGFEQIPHMAGITGMVPRLNVAA
jgi:ABC-type Zn2+ transport system substrate-binding protein/surface adhesin